MSIAENLKRVKEQIKQAALRAGRLEDEIELLAVTKNHTSDEVATLIKAGANNFGENRVQEAAGKAPLFPEANWQLIGHLQRNKANKAVELFSCVHSVDSLRIAVALSAAAARAEITLDIYCEFNIGEEVSKHGFTASEAESVVSKIAELPNLNIIGLMTMAPFIDDEIVVRGVFSKLRNLRDELLKNGDAPSTCVGLSMGMSTDFEYAILEGASVVRIGSALFE